MTGSWHLYRPGERWQKPSHRAVVVIETPDFVAPCFSAPVVELLTEWQAKRHPDLVELGPDAITQEFDPEEAKRRMRRRPDVEIGVALLDQRAMAGVGNVFKSEVLFLKRVSPFLKVGELPDEVLESVIQEARRLLLLNRERGSRRTHFGLDERERLWVYGRSGEPCRVCGQTLRMRRQGLDARSTYYCPECQNVSF
jgi:endonuclease-8